MLSVYPHGSGSLYIAQHAISSSHASSANYIAYVASASNADSVLYPISGSSGRGICLITTTQYKQMVALGRREICPFVID